MLGWLMVAQGTGGLVGGLLMGQFGKNFSSRRISAIGLVITGIVIFAIISIPHSELVFPLMSIAGLAATIWIVSSETLLQLGTSNQFRGRIFGTLGTTSALASLVGMLLAGALADLVGLVPILCISGGLYILSGVLAWIILPKTVRFQPSQPITVEKEISPLQAPMN